MVDMEEGLLLDIRKLKQFFPIQRGFLKKTVGYVKAVNNVNLNIKENETLGLVGESGCGKTTLGRSILRLYEPTDGEIYFRSNNEVIPILELGKKEIRKMRSQMQVIFQDPYSSLNERMTVLGNVGEPLLNNNIAKGKELEEKVANIITEVGLQEEHLRRYPHSFSGGQRQRVGIARALVINPKFIVADESVSALDVSIQAQILNLLKDLQDEFNLTYLFISHDLSVVRYMSDRIAVMYVGRIAEVAPREKLLLNPSHPYTEALLSAVPRASLTHHLDRIMMPGNPADASNLPSGCNFHPRCRYSQKICEKQEPELKQIGEDHYVSCHLADSLNLKGISISA